jgi:hypothetical protein
MKGDTMSEIDTSNAISIDGFFKNTQHGEVFQTSARNLWKWGKVEVGSVIDPEDDETLEKLGRPFVVSAIGSEFCPGNKLSGTKFVYLYLSEPKKVTESVKIQREYNEDVDGAMGHFESEMLRELGQTGELPGA